MKFTVQAQRGRARAGRLQLPHGEVQTPVFMPVGTLASVKGVSQDLLEELGISILLGNTYHLYLRPGVEQVRRLGGLHRFMSWERCLLTDSGGFQVFSLSQLRKVTEEGVAFRSHLDGSSHFFSPESATAAQIGLGADVIMAFDECTEYPAEPARARASMELTLRWAARCKNYFEVHKHEVPWALDNGQSPVAGQGASEEEDDRGPVFEMEEGPRGPALKPVGADKHRVHRLTPLPLGSSPSGETGRSLAQHDNSAERTQSLFGIVQGAMDTELRRESAERTIDIGFPGYAIGGLSVGEPRELTREIVARTLEHLPEDSPRYLMGVGYPEEIRAYALMGVDMMDCVLPTRAARHGLLFTSEGRITIKNARFAQDQGPLDPNCGCPVCRRYSRAYLRHLYASNEVLAQVLNTVHNLSYYLDTMGRVRQSIIFGEFTSSLSGMRSPDSEWT